MNAHAFFKKKVYSRIYNPEPSTTLNKKIVPSSTQGGLREEFKKLFLPLLIDVFGLRKQIETSKVGKHHPFSMGEALASPEEILQKLTLLQEDIEESKWWCEGVIVQIEKGIAEAKEALQFNEPIPHNYKNEW